MDSSSTKQDTSSDFQNITEDKLLLLGEEAAYRVAERSINNDTKSGEENET